MWRPVDHSIEVTAFEPLSVATWQAVTDEARAMAALLVGRDPATYGRYARWWNDLASDRVGSLASH